VSRSAHCGASALAAGAGWRIIEAAAYCRAAATRSRTWEAASPTSPASSRVAGLPLAVFVRTCRLGIELSRDRAIGRGRRQAPSRTQLRRCKRASWGRLSDGMPGMVCAANRRRTVACRGGVDGPREWGNGEGRKYRFAVAASTAVSAVEGGPLCPGLLMTCVAPRSISSKLCNTSLPFDRMAEAQTTAPPSLAALFLSVMNRSAARRLGQ